MPTFRTFHNILFLIAFNYLIMCPFAYSLGQGFIDFSFIKSEESISIICKKKHEKGEEGFSASDGIIRIEPDMYAGPECDGRLYALSSLQPPNKLTTITSVRLIL